MNDYEKLVEALKCCFTDQKCCYRNCSACPYEPFGNDCEDISLNALNAIEQLVKERDAAIVDLKKLRYCSNCKLCTDTVDDEYYWCSAFCDWNEYNDTCEDWEWRGVQE